jgi:membrane fusion protein, multidrug efflux system
MKRILLVSIILASMIMGGGALLRQHRLKAVQATTLSPLMSVEVITPSRSSLQREVEVYGSLAPKASTEVKNEIPGRVVRVNVKDWDRVKAGDRLMELDPTDGRLALNRADAGLKMAKAQLLKARVDANQARREWNRALKLKDAGLITGKELDARQSDQEAAHAQVELALAQVAQAQSQVAEASHSLEKSLVIAPIDGVVCQRSAGVGDYVKEGSLLFMVVDNRVLDLTASVSAADLAQVSEGQVLTFSVDGIAQRTFQGLIKRVNPVVSSTDRSGKILAEVDNSDGQLKGGLYARGRVTVEERRDVLVLPRAALSGWDLQKGTARVFVVDESGGARLLTVTAGLSTAELVEITSGLAGSERVVVRGGYNLRDGDQVQVVSPGGNG